MNILNLKVKNKIITQGEEDDKFKLSPGVIIDELAITGKPRTDPDEKRQVKSYRIIGRFSSGESSSGSSYGYSYLAEEIVDDPQIPSNLVFIKTPRISKSLPNDDTARTLAELFRDFQNEFQNRNRIAELNSSYGKVAAEIIGIGIYGVEESNLDLAIPFLVQEFIDEFNMIEFFTSYQDGKYLNDNEFTGIHDPDLWFMLAGKIIDLVRRVHNRQIIHGDIVPKNILLRENGGEINPILVDFGRSFRLDLSSLTGSPVRKTSHYVAPECRDQNEAWYTPADIYSLGGVLYYLATGFPPPDIKEFPSIFPHENSWAKPTQEQTDLWKSLIHDGFSKNRHLMAKNEGIVKIIDKCLRPSPSDRYSSAEKVLQALSAVNYAERTDTKIDEEIDKLQAEWKRIQRDGKKWDDVFGSILTDKLVLIRKELADMEKGHFEIYGEREDLIDTLVKYMGVLRKGDVYVTVTVPDYWTPGNLGVNGRFLTVNKDLVRNGVHVNRLFVISKDDLKKGSTSRRILQAHVSAWNSLDEKHRATRPNFIQDEQKNGMMYVGCLLFDDKAEVLRYQRRTNHVAIWSRAGGRKKMSIVFLSRPIYSPEGEKLSEVGTQIIKVRFRELSGSDNSFEMIQRLFDHEEIKLLAELKELQD